jgi:hypothetical protein
MGRRCPAWGLGEAVQVEPIKPTLKAPGTQRLKLKYDDMLSILLEFCSQIQLAPLQLGLRRRCVGRHG